MIRGCGGFRRILFFAYWWSLHPSGICHFRTNLVPTNVACLRHFQTHSKHYFYQYFMPPAFSHSAAKSQSDVILVAKMGIKSRM